MSTYKFCIRPVQPFDFWSKFTDPVTGTLSRSPDRETAHTESYGAKDDFCGVPISDNFIYYNMHEEAIS